MGRSRRHISRACRRRQRTASSSSDDGRYVSLRTYCHLQLARLPAEGLGCIPPSRRPDRRAVVSRRHCQPRRADYCAASSTNCFAAAGATTRCWRLANWHWNGATSRPLAAMWEQISPCFATPSAGRFGWRFATSTSNANWPEDRSAWRERPQSRRLGSLIQIPISTLPTFGPADPRIHSRRRVRPRGIGARRFPSAASERYRPPGRTRWALCRSSGTVAELPLIIGPPIVQSAGWSTFAGSQSARRRRPASRTILVPAWAEPVPADRQAKRSRSQTRRSSSAERSAAALSLSRLNHKPQPAVRESQQPLELLSHRRR